MAPKVLLVSTCRWFSTARLAMAFAGQGCSVELLCPSDHPATSVGAVGHRHPYNALTPLRSFRSGILASLPDILIPCDDLAMRLLHRLYAAAVGCEDSAMKALRALLTLSLGDPAGYAPAESREKLLALVEQEGILAPATKTVHSSTEVEDWLSRFGLPAVLKADRTSGGEGIRIVHTLREALRAFQNLEAPLATVIAAKRLLVDGDWNCMRPWLEQRRRSVSIQTFIPGPDANMAVACWQGKILSSITVEVLQTWKPKGPATVIRLLENAEMQRAAETIVRRLNFSGLCGFDFLLEKTTGAAYLIEMNARATQTAPLPMGSGRDLIASLCGKIGGNADSSGGIELRGDRIALFPLAWQGNTSTEMFTGAYHDIPWAEPQLMQIGMKQIKGGLREKWMRWVGRAGRNHL